MENIICKSLNFQSSYGNMSEVNVSFIGTDLSMLMKLFNLGHIPFSAIKDRKDEFECLWCGTANQIEHVVCSRCGAPRGVLIK